MMPHNPANGESEKEAAWKYYFHSLTGLPTTPEYKVVANKLLAETKRIFDPNGYISTAAKEQADLFIGKLDSISSKIDSLATLRNGETQTAQSKGKRGRHERAPGVTNQWIAQQFNNYAIPLPKKIYSKGKPTDESYLRTTVIPDLKAQGLKPSKDYGMIPRIGLCLYEPMRGGKHFGFKTIGSITERRIKAWINAYPDASNPEPRCGFHEGMLKDRKSIQKSAEEWGDYWRRYALAFAEWRTTHEKSPRKQFQYNPSPVIHGAERMATTTPQS